MEIAAITIQFATKLFETNQSTSTPSVEGYVKIFFMKFNVLLTFFVGAISALDYVIKTLEECSTSGNSSTVLKCKMDETSTVLMLQLNFTEKITKKKVRTLL